MHRTDAPKLMGFLPLGSLLWATATSALVLGLGTMAGCAAEIEPASGPVYGYEQYPSTYYDGRPVYLVNGQWYYSNGNRWYRYQREPGELARHRAEYEHARERTGSRPAGRPPAGHGGGPEPGRPPQGRGREHKSEHRY